MSNKTSYVGALSPEYALLGLIAQQPAHGYELHQRLEAELGEIWHISLSQTYNILNRLEARGFIDGRQQEQDKLPARRQFRLTQAGSQRFEAWLSAPSGCSVRAIRVEFMTRLYFAQLRDPNLAKKLLDIQIAETRVGLEHLKFKATKIPEGLSFNRLGLQLRLQQLSSILDWLAECKDVLDQINIQPGWRNSQDQVT
jgi:DNA-binding PadR family transcriptional regulator